MWADKIKNIMKRTENKDFAPESLDNTTPEPTIDSSVDGSEPNDESFQEELASAKMAEEKAAEQTDWQDKYIRLSAEFDNYRKRTSREKLELITLAGADVLKAMLSTADDFDRALLHITNEVDRQGVELIYNKFLATLKSNGVEVMDLNGKPFDVDFAEAIAKMPASNGEQSGTVMEMAEKGYMIRDKVLRFAKVVVFE